MYGDLDSNPTTATTAAPVMRSATNSAEKRRLRTAVLCGPWALFTLLVAFGIHGSSTGVSATWWSPDKPYTGYLLDAQSTSTEDWPGGLQNLLMNKARRIRSDESLGSTNEQIMLRSKTAQLPCCLTWNE